MKARLSLLFTVFLLIAVLTISSLKTAKAEIEGEDLLLFEDFENGMPPDWRSDGGWEVVAVGDDHALRCGEHTWITPDLTLPVDYRLTFRVRLEGDAGIHINVRHSMDGRYFAGFRTGVLYLSKQVGEQFFDLDMAEYPPSDWYEAEIQVEGGTIVISVNGQERISYTDLDPLRSGGIAFEALGGGNVYLDDLSVFGKPVGGPLPEGMEEITWIYTGGPLGGLGYDVRMHPEDPDLMYVSDAYAGVFISEDGGAYWYSSNQGITTRTGDSGDSIPIFSLTIDPNDPNIIWAGTQYQSAVYKSVDGGRNWTRVGQGIVERGLTIRGFTVEPGNSDVVYAAAEISSWEWNTEPINGREFDLTKGVVYQSVDGGENWTAIWRGDNLARYVWIDPRDVNVLYISTGIFDREAANSDPTDAGKSTPGGEGVIKSVDGGKTWQHANNGIENLYIGTLFMHPQDPDILLAGAGNNQYHIGSGVYLTTDGGESWVRTLESSPIEAVEFSTSDPQIAYAGSADEVFRSTDGGRSWVRVSGGERGWGPPGVRAGFPIDFQVDPRDPDRIFTNNYGGGNFLSEDGGETWRVASQGYTGAQVREIAVDPDNPGRVYAAARSGIFTSADGGATWEGISYIPYAMMEWTVVTIDPANTARIFASSNWNPVLMYSENMGHYWAMRLPYPQEGQYGGGWTSITFAPSNPKIIYAGACSYVSAGGFTLELDSIGVYKSEDGGETWQEANDSVSQNAAVFRMVVDPYDPQKVYAAAVNRGLLKTTDGGGSWTAMNNGLPENPRIVSVAVSAADPQIVLAGRMNGGMYRSTDGGESWTMVTAGLNPEATVFDILFDPTDPQVAYASDTFTGVYRSGDAGESWVRLSEGLLSRHVNALAISGDGMHLYAATEGMGVFRLDLNGTPPEAAPAIETLSEEAAPPEEGSASQPQEETEVETQPSAEEPEPPAGEAEPGGGLCSASLALPLMVGLVGVALEGWKSKKR